MSAPPCGTRTSSRRDRIGRPIGVADAQIAAICRDLSATLATRNTADFEETGIELINLEQQGGPYAGRRRIVK